MSDLDRVARGPVAEGAALRHLPHAGRIGSICPGLGGGWYMPRPGHLRRGACLPPLVAYDAHQSERDVCALPPAAPVLRCAPSHAAAGASVDGRGQPGSTRRVQPRAVAQSGIARLADIKRSCTVARPGTPRWREGIIVGAPSGGFVTHVRVGHPEGRRRVGITSGAAPVAYASHPFGSYATQGSVGRNDEGGYGDHARVCPVRVGALHVAERLRYLRHLEVTGVAVAGCCGADHHLRVRKKHLWNSSEAVVVVKTTEHNPQTCAFVAITSYTAAAQRVGWGLS